MSIFTPFDENEEFFTDNRSDHDEEYVLNTRVKMDKKTLDEFVAFFPPAPDGNFPPPVRWFLGGKLSFSVYLSNSSSPEHPDSINMVVASDSGNKHNADLISALGGMTLSVFGFNTPEWLYITKIKKVPAVVGSISNRVIKSQITLFYNSDPNAENLPRNLLNRIFELPNFMEETKHIAQRIAHWDEYLNINEQIAREAQLLTDYVDWKRDGNISQLVFVTDCNEMSSAHLNSDIQLVLHTEYENGHPTYRGPVVGTVGSFDKRTNELWVNMDFDFMEMLDDGRVEIPQKAKLFISKWGDLVQIGRLRYGLQTFARGQAANPYLDVFLFDSSKARLPAINGETLYTENLLQPSLNPEQKRAVEGVINSDDLYLIQGPPGTGKTTVIAEICYQNAIRGKKTLIASQTNLAVDNALGKLVHHPKIRALRKGNEQSVQEEGKLFTENNVISTWLSKTSADCASRLESHTSALKKVEEAENKLEYISDQYAKLTNAEKRRNTAGIQKTVVEKKISETGQKIVWIGQSVSDFLDGFQKDNIKKLIDNPFGVDDELIECAALCYKTKYTYDEKRNEIKNAIDDIRSTVASLEDTAASFDRELKKADKKGEYPIFSKGTDVAASVSYESWQKEASLAKKIFGDLMAKKPSGISKLFGVPKERMQAISVALGCFDGFKHISDLALSGEKEKMKQLAASNQLKGQAEELSEKADRCVERSEEELQALRDELTAIEESLSADREEILRAREEINGFNQNLPYGVRAEAIELVQRNADICGYYRKLWEVQKNDDAIASELIGGWMARIDNGSSKDYDEFKQLYIDNANVIGITCSQSGSKEFTSLYPVFDVAIIDEVSKATPPELILSVLKAKKIVLVGDHKQLPPMLGSDTYEEVAKKLNISEESAQHMKLSLFEELFVKAPPELKTMLSTQYRMHSQIMESINQFYIEENGFGLRCGLPDPDSARRHGCHGKAIGEGDHALWVDVPMFEENREIRSDVNHSFSNPAECECIKDILLTINDNLEANGYDGKKRIGIISFYSNQVRLMESEFLNREFAQRANKLSLRIGSVDRFQGIECPVVICSFVRNNDRGEIGFAKDPRRVNVALSRSQELSIIVGSAELFCYRNNSPEASNIYKTITQQIYRAGGERSVWDFK